MNWVGGAVSRHRRAEGDVFRRYQERFFQKEDLETIRTGLDDKVAAVNYGRSDDIRAIMATAVIYDRTLPKGDVKKPTAPRMVSLKERKPAGRQRRNATQGQSRRFPSVGHIPFAGAVSNAPSNQVTREKKLSDKLKRTYSDSFSDDNDMLSMTIVDNSRKSLESCVTESVATVGSLKATSSDSSPIDSESLDSAGALDEQPRRCLNAFKPLPLVPAAMAFIEDQKNTRSTTDRIIGRSFVASKRKLSAIVSKHKSPLAKRRRQSSAIKAEPTQTTVANTERKTVDSSAISSNTTESSALGTPAPVGHDLQVEDNVTVVSSTSAGLQTIHRQVDVVFSKLLPELPAGQAGHVNEDLESSVVKRPLRWMSFDSSNSTNSQVDDENGPGASATKSSEEVDCVFAKDCELSCGGNSADVGDEVSEEPRPSIVETAGETDHVAADADKHCLVETSTIGGEVLPTEESSIDIEIDEESTDEESTVKATGVAADVDEPSVAKTPIAVTELSQVDRTTIDDDRREASSFSSQRSDTDLFPSPNKSHPLPLPLGNSPTPSSVGHCLSYPASPTILDDLPFDGTPRPTKTSTRPATSVAPPKGDIGRVRALSTISDASLCLSPCSVASSLVNLITPTSRFNLQKRL